MNAIWRFKNKIVTIPKYKTTLPQQVVQEFDISNFTSGKNYLIYKANFETGRSWKACELRLKSTLELHKLWYILLKEKLALRADFYHYIQKRFEYRHIKKDMVKIQKSMARLLTVVNERNILHNEFLTFLEFYYIQKQKSKEIEENRKSKELIIIGDTKQKNASTEGETKNEFTSSHNEKTNAEGLNKESKENSNSNESDKSHVDKEIRKESNNEKKFKKTKIKLENLDVEKPPVQDSMNVTILDEREIKIVKSLERPFKNKDLLNSYVKNSHLIKGKERKRLISEIRAARAKQAKLIFTKELVAISQKLQYSKMISKNKLNEDIIKKLENIV